MLSRLLRSSVLVLSASACLAATAAANELRLPDGMGGVPDIGAIPCHVFSEMLTVGPMGTRLSLLTWADGYLYAQSQQTMEEIVVQAMQRGDRWDFDRLTDHFVDYCAANPDDFTRDAVIDLEARLRL